MLKLIKVGAYNGQNKRTTSEMATVISNAINNNSEVFTSVVNNYDITISSEILSDVLISFGGTNTSYVLDSGYVLAIDDEKGFLLIISALVLNTFMQSNVGYDSIPASISSLQPGQYLMTVFSKDINEEYFNVTPEKLSLGGISKILDIGQKATSDYTTEGDYILRQGAIRNHIVPELFFSMTRLGACGDIIEKDGHQYTCIAGPVFYQIS